MDHRTILRELGEGGLPASPETFLQSEFWAAFKASPAWKPRRFILDVADGSSLPVLLMERRLPGGFCFAYAPRPPLAPEYLSEAASALSRAMPKSCVFIRFDLASPLIDHGNGESFDPGKPFRKAATDVQVPDTVIVDLRRGAEEILAGMKPKWRYNVKLSAKKGVNVSSVSAKEAAPGILDAAMKRFYSLYRETSLRDRISLHGESYYRRLLELARSRDDAPDLRIWSAVAEGETLAMIITLFQGKEAVYLYGASSNSKREYMPAYALQWAAMSAAIEAGCERYDFFGIPPSGDEASSLHGLYRFKTGFGGRIVKYPGSWDVPLRPFLYGLYSAAERARGFYHKVLKKGGRRGGRTRAESGS